MLRSSYKHELASGRNTRCRAKSQIEIMSEVVTLSIVGGFNRGDSVRATTGHSLVVGRNSTSDLRVVDPRISREHFRVEHGGDIWTVVDLQSRAGTFVNGTEVESTSLANGDIISAGDTNFRFRIEDSVHADESAANRRPPLLSRLNLFKRTNTVTLMLSQPQPLIQAQMASE